MHFLKLTLQSIKCTVLNVLYVALWKITMIFKEVNRNDNINIHSDFICEHEEKAKAGAEVLLHTMTALFKAGPNSSHIDLMSKLFDTTPSIDEYIKVISD